MVLIPEFVILFVLAGPVLALVALIDLLRRPTADWTNAGQDRLVWALVVVFVGIVGPILYLTLGRSKLNASTSTEPQSVRVS